MRLKLFRYKSCSTAKSLFRESQMWTPEKLDLSQKSSFPHPQICLDWVYNLRFIICKCTCNSLDKNYFVEVISWRLHLSYNCTSLEKKIIILWHSFEIFIFKTRQKSLFCRHFWKHCFSCSSLIPAKYLYVSTISVAKHLIKRVGLCFLRCFSNKTKDFLMNGS